MIFVFFTALLTLFIFWWLIAKFFLLGPDLSHFDHPVGQIFDDHENDAHLIETFLSTWLSVRKQALATKSLRKGFKLVRDFADNLSSDLQSDCEFRPTNANGVSAEWAIAPGVDTRRRVLFFHGGAFILGSAKGHRRYAHHLSHIANAAVLSVNYRMLPEHRRSLASRDSQDAYRWILDNGPNGAEPVETLLVSGDSAGGNLALMISGWSKTQALRKPDGVICFSPSTDITASSPTINSNKATDPILGEGLGSLSKIPKPIAAWLGLFLMRTNPAAPLNSPLFGDLSDLPPTLIQVSDNEMLLGESVRYTNKAIAAGSNVTLQVWKNQIHDWALFTPESGSAKQAFEQVAVFIASLEKSDSSSESRLAKAS